MKNRDLYLNQLISFKDKPLIKVVTGIRRCGKSTLLALYEHYLLEQGIPRDAIISINFESLAFESIKNYKDLYQSIKERLPSEDKAYLLLDEVQQVSSWEKAVNSFLVDFNVDICITGSNAWLLSSELSTLLSGRYIEIRMLPLSFREYLDFNDVVTADRNDAFQQYLRYGSLPAVSELLDRPSTIPDFLKGIYNTVIMKDVVQRGNVRDVALLENVLRYIAQNVGSPISTKKISDYLTSTGRKTAHETIDNYLTMLESAFIVYKARRFDLKGKMHLKTLEKYYMVDTGIRNALLDYRGEDYGHTLENVVYLELLRRGYTVSIGKVGTLEVDFIVTKENHMAYYQVAASVVEKEVRDRELRPLKAINDNYEKTILSMDDTFIQDYDGIKNINILNFLLDDPLQL